MTVEVRPIRIDASRLWWLRGSDRSSVERALACGTRPVTTRDLEDALTAIGGLDPSTIALVVESMTDD